MPVNASELVDTAFRSILDDQQLTYLAERFSPAPSRSAQPSSVQDRGALRCTSSAAVACCSTWRMNMESASCFVSAGTVNNW